MAHIEALSDAENIPSNYLVQILNELRNAGLITSKRGKQGGYALARPATRITLIEILRAMEPEWLDSRFQPEGHSGEQVARVWAEIGRSFEEKVAGYTLEDLVEADSAAMYHI